MTSKRVVLAVRTVEECNWIKNHIHSLNPGDPLVIETVEALDELKFAYQKYALNCQNIGPEHFDRSTREVLKPSRMEILQVIDNFDDAFETKHHKKYIIVGKRHVIIKMCDELKILISGYESFINGDTQRARVAEEAARRATEETARRATEKATAEKAAKAAAEAAAKAADEKAELFVDFLNESWKWSNGFRRFN
jgi:hypothetical protein